MSSRSSVFGILQPVGGGDPIPLIKKDIIIGRRPSCDISLDYENISGKHCALRLTNGVWSIRDLGSTNGTTVNGARLTSEQSVMPEEELGIAGHLFTIDYEPAGPEAFLNSHKQIDEEVVVERERHSLMDLAGLDTDKVKFNRPKKAPKTIERLSADEADFDDTVPAHFKKPIKAKPQGNDDSFFDIIEDEVKKPD
jgi:pSer/pThr/pTyr-binding forkhead associated (FHA) protein